MKNYKYRLLKHSERKRYSICPNCGRKRFVPIMDIETGEVFPNHGRCERVNSCGFFSMPNGSQKGEFKKPVEKKADYIPVELVEKTLNKFEGLDFFFDLEIEILTNDNFKDANINAVFENYYIGKSKINGGQPIFWQIDLNENVRSGKIITFNGLKRNRDITPVWVHKLLNNKDYELNQCAFGLHTYDDEKPICVVESEKTAIICALAYPKYNWFAVGGSQNLNSTMFGGITQGMFLFADNDHQFDKWRLIALERPELFHLIEWRNGLQLSEGDDIADALLSGQSPQFNLNFNPFEIKKKTPKEAENITIDNKCIGYEIEKVIKDKSSWYHEVPAYNPNECPF